MDSRLKHAGMTTVDYLLSTINYPLSTINYQLSTIDYQLTTDNSQLDSIFKYMDSRRQSRINSLIRQAIGNIVEKGLKRNFPGLITITRVKISPDLSVANVYYTAIGGSEEEAGRVLAGSRHHIISNLARSVRLRILPQLRFSPDEGIKQANRLEELIREIHRDENAR